LVRVPLMIKFPHGEYEGVRISKPVSLLDVMPTILEYLGIELRSNDCDGISLLKLVKGKKIDRHHSRDIRIELHLPVENPDSMMCAVIRDMMKCIRHKNKKQTVAFDLASDPREQRPVEDKAANQIKDKLFSHWPVNDEEKEGKKRGKVDPELMERFRSLGYIK
jgi:arylsulfatase A-like enzyme